MDLGVTCEPSDVDCAVRARKRFACGRTITIPILRSGTLAWKFCRDAACAELVAVFDRSVYLRSADMFVCIGTPGIGNGPITMIGAFDSPTHLAEFGLRPGSPAAISERCITIGSAVRFTFEECELWHPPEWPAPLPYLQLANVGNGVVSLLSAEAFDEGFAQVYRLSRCGTFETPLARIARERIAHFQSWLCDALESDCIQPAASLDAIHSLIGLGLGLTPSGDDFLVGALALLDALAERKAHGALAHAVAAAPRGLTSPLSDCLLRAAAAGHAGEPLWRAVSAIISGNLDAAIACVRQIGHSSGWDMLVGVASALPVVTAGRIQRCGQAAREECVSARGA
jgi:hypothetical protein